MHAFSFGESKYMGKFFICSMCVTKDTVSQAENLSLTSPLISPCSLIPNPSHQVLLILPKQSLLYLLIANDTTVRQPSLFLNVDSFCLRSPPTLICCAHY